VHILDAPHTLIIEQEYDIAIELGAGTSIARID
jgi:hypothetical protein